MKQIAAALVKAQKEFGPALKSSTNPHFRSRYADLAACVEAVIDGLNNNGIALIQQCHECADGVIVETTFIHESGETLSCGRLHVPASKQDPQGYGSALTYARRYSLMAGCGIAPEDDDGNAGSKKSMKHKPTDGALVEKSRESVLIDTVEAIKERQAQDDVIGAYELYMQITDTEEKVFIWDKLDSKIRSAIKKHGDSLKGQ